MPTLDHESSASGPRRYSSSPLITALVCVAIILLVFFATSRPPDHRPPYLRLLSSIRILSISSQDYAASHNSNFPPHIAAMILSKSLDRNYFASIGLPSSILPTPRPPESDWATIAPAVDADCLFIYTAADLPAIPNQTSDIIFAYSKPNSITPGHRVLLYADGHSEYERDADLPKLFTASNTARAKLHLPPFTLDGQPPKPQTK